MNNYFTYSVLQYKHSLVLGEALNVGILFYFPNEQKLEFVSGNGHRAKSIYPDFDNALFNNYIKIITTKIRNRVDLFHGSKIEKSIRDYIHENILAEDAAGLLFCEPVQIKDIYFDASRTINEYSNLLLPGIIISKPNLIKHNESFIIKKYTGYIFQSHKELENRFIKNELVKTKNLKIKFELAWQGRKRKKLIKPISFDLTNSQHIQEKAATFLGYLTQLEDYANRNNASFDFLISRPQSKDLNRDYENALDLLDYAKAPKQLVTEKDWEKYSQQTIDELLHNG